MKINPFIYILVALFVIVGLFFVFKPRTATNSPIQNQTTTSPNTSVPPTSSSTKTFDLKIQGRKIVSGSETLTVTQGNSVVFKITADENEEFHLHAYDNSVELEAGKTAELSFIADKSGRFPFELEKSKMEIGALEVQPK